MGEGLYLHVSYLAVATAGIQPLGSTRAKLRQTSTKDGLACYTSKLLSQTETTKRAPTNFEFLAATKRFFALCTLHLHLLRAPWAANTPKQLT